MPPLVRGPPPKSAGKFRLIWGKVDGLWGGGPGGVSLDVEEIVADDELVVSTTGYLLLDEYP